MRIAALVLAFGAVVSARSFALSPEELAEIVNTKGAAGLTEIWDLLVVKDSPTCDAESLVARLDFGTTERESARVAVLEISGDCRRDVLFLGKTATTWRCLGHEVAYTRSQPVQVRNSWGGGLLCAVALHGSGTGCSGDSETWFLLQPERALEICRFASCGSEIIFGQGAGDSDEDFDLNIEERGSDDDCVKFHFDLKWTLSFENKDGGCRHEDVLAVGASGSMSVNKQTGEVVLKSAKLGDGWTGIKKLERGDARLVCALSPERVIEQARTAPVSCGAFMRRCAAECDDPCLAAKLKDILRERGMAEEAIQQDGSAGQDNCPNRSHAAPK